MKPWGSVGTRDLESGVVLAVEVLALALGRDLVFHRRVLLRGDQDRYSLDSPIQRPAAVAPAGVRSHLERLTAARADEEPLRERDAQRPASPWPDPVRAPTPAASR